LPLPIDLLPVSRAVALRDLLERYPRGGIFACDFYVEGAEHGEDVVGGYRLAGRVLNVDHHAPTGRMARAVSSTNLALDWHADRVRRGVADQPRDAVVVVNHTDCDSVLSSGIVSGVLEPLPEYGEAALAADHTGDENDLADALQGLERCRDLALSFETLHALRLGAPLPDEARAGLERRRRKRACAAEYVARGAVALHGPVAFGVLEGEVDSEFFPALVPAAAVFVLAIPRPNDAGRWTVKLRLGRGAPPRFTLHDLHLTSFDPAYGGRWNAGANSRAGGTTIPPERYAEEVRRRVEAALPLSDAM
jgi:hypothetical protein